MPDHPSTSLLVTIPTASDTSKAPKAVKDRQVHSRKETEDTEGCVTQSREAESEGSSD
jgi:hypothetical protein